MPIALILLILGWNYLINRDLKSDRAEVAGHRQSDRCAAQQSSAKAL